MNRETGEHKDILSSSEERAAHRSEEREELGAGIDQQHQHIQKIADRTPFTQARLLPPVPWCLYEAPVASCLPGSRSVY